MLFDKNGYLKSKLSEKVVNEIICKYAEQKEMESYLKNEPRSLLDIARTLIPIQELGPGALPIYNRDSEVGIMVANLEGVKKTELISVSVAPTQKQYYAHGMNCKRCNTINEYVTEANQPDGSYICYSCRSGF